MFGLVCLARSSREPPCFILPVIGSSATAVCNTWGWLTVTFTTLLGDERNEPTSQFSLMLAGASKCFDVEIVYCPPACPKQHLLRGIFVVQTDWVVSSGRRDFVVVDSGHKL